MNLVDKLKHLKEEILWSNPRKGEEIVEWIGGFPRKETYKFPNDAATKRAAVIQEAIDRLEELKQFDRKYHYDEDFIEQMGA